MAVNKVVALMLVAVVVAAAVVPATEAVTCSPVELSPCGPAILAGQEPSGACCEKLKEQRPCLCQYKNNPSLRQYVNSPGAQRVASTCKVTVSC